MYNGINQWQKRREPDHCAQSTPRKVVSRHHSDRHLRRLHQARGCTPCTWCRHSLTVAAALIQGPMATGQRTWMCVLRPLLHTTNHSYNTLKRILLQTISTSANLQEAILLVYVVLKLVCVSPIFRWKKSCRVLQLQNSGRFLHFNNTSFTAGCTSACSKPIKPNQYIQFNTLSMYAKIITVYKFHYSQMHSPRSLRFFAKHTITCSHPNTSSACSNSLTKLQ